MKIRRKKDRKIRIQRGQKKTQRNRRKIRIRRRTKTTQAKGRKIRIRRHKTKKTPTAPRTLAQYSAKTDAFKNTWDRVIGVINKMRSTNVSLGEASREAGINPQTVRRWGGSVLKKHKNGQYIAKPFDRLLRVLLLPTPDGIREIATADSRQASLVGQYWVAAHKYLQTGDSSQIQRFVGKRILDANGDRIPLLTDLSELDRLGNAGELSFETIYAK